MKNERFRLPYCPAGKSRKGLILTLMVVTLAVVIPLLCINLLASAAGQTETSEEDVHFKSPKYIPLLTDEDIRDQSRSSEYGLRGYIDIDLVDSPKVIELAHGETWVGKMRIYFVSRDMELKQVEIQLDPKSPWGLKNGIDYERDDGTIEHFDFASLITYDPSGSITLTSGKPLFVDYTVRIPADLPSYVNEIRLGPIGIFTPNDTGIPLLSSIETMVGVK